MNWYQAWHSYDEQEALMATGRMDGRTWAWSDELESRLEWSSWGGGWASSASDPSACSASSSAAEDSSAMPLAQAKSAPDHCRSADIVAAPLTKPVLCRFG